MIASIQMADVKPSRAPGLLRRTPKPDTVPGLLYADLLLAAKLGPEVLPSPYPGRIALFAVWRDDAALDAFNAGDPLAAALAGGRSVRLQPLRAAGSWSGLPALARNQREIRDDEPVAALTYGRLKLRRAVTFLRTSARAEADAVADPALISGTGLARPPRHVSTFSLWRSAGEMHEFARRGPGHAAALRSDNRRGFHHESIFVRFRPYALAGDWQD